MIFMEARPLESLFPTRINQLFLQWFTKNDWSHWCIQKEAFVCQQMELLSGGISGKANLILTAS